jgi:hypothetical protein
MYHTLLVSITGMDVEEPTMIGLNSEIILWGGDPSAHSACAYDVVFVFLDISSLCVTGAGMDCDSQIPLTFSRLLVLRDTL